MKQGTGLKMTMWALSVLTYVLTTINRSSFSALGTFAQHHFGVEATIVSTFVMVQLAVYALAQIPVGILLDRFGASIMLCAGLVLMSAGQFTMGFSPSISLAILARVLVGAGDACIFVSMIKIIADWFTPKTIPTLNQVSGLIGQGGQLLAVAPLAAVVAAMGWSGTFSVLAALCLILGLILCFFLQEKPGRVPLFQSIIATKRLAEHHDVAHEAPLNGSASAHDHAQNPITHALPVLGPQSSGVFPALKTLLSRPGVRLGFWVHYATCFSTNSFVLLWGVPFMTGGLGYSFATASTIVSLNIVAIMVAGFAAGPVFSRYIRQRVQIVTALVIILVLLWCAVLLYPGGAPAWLMTLTAMVGGVGGPASMVAFEIVRTHTPITQRGIATGIANMGGFVGALINVFAIGFILDALGAGTPDTYNLEAFRVAMAFQIPMMVAGIAMMLFERPKAQRYLNEKGIF